MLPSTIRHWDTEQVQGFCCFGLEAKSITVEAVKLIEPQT